MESDPGHGDATPRVERAVGPFDEAEAALARREAFDAQAWEAALADKTALAPAPEPWAPELDEAMLRRLIDQPSERCCSSVSSVPQPAHRGRGRSR